MPYAVAILYLIEWFRDEAYRRRMEVRLDRREGTNTLLLFLVSGVPRW